MRTSCPWLLRSHFSRSQKAGSSSTMRMVAMIHPCVQCENTGDRTGRSRRLRYDVAETEDIDLVGGLAPRRGVAVVQEVVFQVEREVFVHGEAEPLIRADTHRFCRVKVSIAFLPV